RHCPEAAATCRHCGGRDPMCRNRPIEDRARTGRVRPEVAEPCAPGDHNPPDRVRPSARTPSQRSRSCTLRVVTAWRRQACLRASALSIAHLQRRDEGFLGNLDLAELAHALLAFL